MERDWYAPFFGLSAFARNAAPCLYSFTPISFSRSEPSRAAHALAVPLSPPAELIQAYSVGSKAEDSRPFELRSLCSFLSDSSKLDGLCGCGNGRGDRQGLSCPVQLGPIMCADDTPPLPSRLSTRRKAKIKDTSCWQSEATPRRRHLPVAYYSSSSEARAAFVIASLVSPRVASLARQGLFSAEQLNHLKRKSFSFQAV